MSKNKITEIGQELSDVQKRRIDDLYQAITFFYAGRSSWRAVRNWAAEAGYPWEEVNAAKRAIGRVLREAGALDSEPEQ